jgi:hypothetical protein
MGKKKVQPSPLPLVPVRVEQETIRFPMHNLAKGKGSAPFRVKLHSVDKHGRKSSWAISTSREYGEPGALAYKIDTIIINKRIEENANSRSPLIKLGSLRAICHELGISKGNTDKVKAALRQNAHTGITARFRYLDRQGVEQTLSADFHRYSVILKGESFPNGGKADAVYIVLDKIYHQLILSARSRPLDYEYLKTLTPSAQRFYELVSPQIYAALKYNLPFAKYRYSEFCQHSALTRYSEWDKAKKQLYPILKLHKASGYLASVRYERVLSGEQPDWMMLLVPGEKAINEYQEFSEQQQHRQNQQVFELQDEPDGLRHWLWDFIPKVS